MKKSVLIYLMILAEGIICLGFLAGRAQAQDVGKMQELQRVIDTQQKQLEAQQNQLEAQQKQLEIQQKQHDAQRQLLQELQTQMQSLAKDAATSTDKDAEMSKDKAVLELPTEMTSEPKWVPPSKRAAISQFGKHDQTGAAGSNSWIGDHSKRHKMPDIKTEIGIHGFAELQIFHDTDGINDNSWVPKEIDVDGSPSQTKFSVNPSRLEISSATPIKSGQLNTFFTLDMNGEKDKADVRLRMAWGEYINENLGLAVLAGQAYTTMRDMKAVTETLDFAGPVGLWGLRQPMLRVTKAVSDSLVAEVAIETPENATYTDANRRERWPDFEAAGTWYTNTKYIKHLRLAGLARDLRANNEIGGTDSELGWSVAGSGIFGLPFLGEKDNFKFNIHYGEGYGGQVNSGPTDAVFDTVNSELKTIGVFGSYGGLQHWWSDSWRSNLVYGFVYADNPGFSDGDLLDNTWYGAANIIWSPFEATTFGLEYLWGRRENKDGEDGTGNRFMFSSRFAF
ncbi:MAG: DcaP family trimeric outer membrane transporter [Desulfobacterales bacterium]|jgi:hypothetical protein